MPPKNSRIGTKEFIEKCRLMHGNKYDYSKVTYTGANDKITVICPQHGEFEIRASAHSTKQKQGCKACGGRPDITTDMFIDRSKKKFKKRFSYKKVQYVNATTPVVITCCEHGDFSIIPGNHLYGNGGCKICSGRPDISNEEYINRLVEKFGDKYDYSFVEYKGAFEEVLIVCKKHGQFKKMASHAIKSLGCPECQKFTQNDFLEKARKVHGKLYDYTDVEYVNTKTFITIKCPEHGVFRQTPNRHLDGRGCPACGIERNILANRLPEETCIIYYLTLSYKNNNFWKVGITTKSIEERYKLLKNDSVELVDSKEVVTTLGIALKAEHEFLKVFGEHLQYRGHILKNVKGGTECFGIDVLNESGITLDDFVRNFHNVL